MQQLLTKLNVNNYYIYDLETGDHWYAQCELRSLYNYSKLSNMTFKELCINMYKHGEISLFYTNGDNFILTLI